MVIAVAKRDTVNRLVPKALNDNKVTDIEFQIILNEMNNYHALKDAVRAKLTRKPRKTLFPLHQTSKN